MIILIKCLQIMKFEITLLMKDLNQRGKSKFEFALTLAMMKGTVNLQRDDTLLNYTLEETMLMNNKDPWRGACEKDPRFFGWLIEGTTIEGDIVMDCIVATDNFRLKLCLIEMESDIHVVHINIIHINEFDVVCNRGMHYGLSWHGTTHGGSRRRQGNFLSDFVTYAQEDSSRGANRTASGCCTVSSPGCHDCHGSGIYKEI